MRLRLPWLIAMPLAVIGTLAGHSVGYWAAVPDAHERAHVLASSGHGYLAYAPLAIALCIAIAALGFVAMVLAAVRREPTVGRRPHLGLVAALPPCAFVLQELLERYAHAGHVHWGLVASAPFLLGLATQLPFSLLAAAIGFALATAAERVGQALRGAQRPRPRALAITFLTWLSVDLPRRAALAGGHAGRGPPLLA
jgi:hypothetical protein